MPVMGRYEARNHQVIIIPLVVYHGETKWSVFKTFL